MSEPRSNPKAVRVVGVVLVNRQRGGLGHRSMLEHRIQHRSILDYTLDRLNQMDQVDEVVVIEQDEHPEFTDSIIAARKWSRHNWRGGLANTTVFDELLSLKKALEVLRETSATSGYFVRGDWCLHDPSLGDAVVKHHRENLDKIKMCFTQAPPGLCGLALHVDTLTAMIEQGACFGNLLGYNPQHARVDPMLLEPNVAIDVSIRNTARRFIFDTNHSRRMIEQFAVQLGERFVRADAMELTALWRELEVLPGFQQEPMEIDIELTPRWVDTDALLNLDIQTRSHIVLPQAHVNPNRSDMTMETAHQLAEQLAARTDVGDINVMFGGLGDALCHADWASIIDIFHHAGVLSIGLRTSLLHDLSSLQRLLDSPVELVQVDLHADTQATYKTVTGSSRFSDVWKNMQWLLKERSVHALPHFVMAMDKTPDNLSDLETFYDRWQAVVGSVLLQSPRTGRNVDDQGRGTDLMHDLSPVAMTPPKRRPCRQIGRRRTIHSNGETAMCDQDWLGTGKRDPQAMCEGCRSWHRL